MMLVLQSAVKVLYRHNKQAPNQCTYGKIQPLTTLQYPDIKHMARIHMQRKATALDGSFVARDGEPLADQMAMF